MSSRDTSSNEGKKSGHTKEKQYHVEWKQKLFGFLCVLGIIVLIALDYWIDRSQRYSSISYDSSSSEYTKPVYQKPSEPYFLHDSSMGIVLSDLKRDGEFLLCRGKAACFGVFEKYSIVFEKDIGPPHSTIKFDHASDGINRGDFASSWIFSDGQELILMSHQNNVLWREKGKYPEVKLLLR